MLKKHPLEMYMLAMTELCQRFTFWGIGNLLVIYLVQSQKFSAPRADYLFGIFTGLAFVLPVAGGYLADRIGCRLPIIWGMGLTALGAFLLATGMPVLLYPALGLAAVGTGIFTPSIYSILGGIYRGKPELREGGFSIYYAAVNLGTLLALLILGEVGTKSWPAAFLIAALVECSGFFFFRKVLRNKQIAAQLADRRVEIQERDVDRRPLHKQEKNRLIVIIVLSVFSILFWTAYNQGGSSMSLFALNFTNRSIGTFTMPASWLLSSESFYLLVLAFPLASLYVMLQKKRLDPSPSLKTAFSLIAMGVCYGIMIIGSLQIPMGVKHAAISPFYLFTAYFFMAIGEMLLAPIGLSLVTHLSPKRYTAMLVGVWYFCIGIALYLGGVLAALMSKLSSLTHFFIFFTALSFGAAVVLLPLVKKLNKMRHMDSL